MSNEALLASWTKPSSDTEQQKQNRTEQMIRDAVRQHPAFNGYDIRVFAKGSYANNTNVRTESDVDIAVQCVDVLYYDQADPAMPRPSPYQGPWKHGFFRSELERALRAKFGNQVDTTGHVAIKVSSSTARVDADVVPCFDYCRFWPTRNHLKGTKIFRKENTSTFNYPYEHLARGRAKNNETAQRYKKTVRILKRTANSMAQNGTHRDVVSYFIESLVYNCPDSMFSHQTWTDTIKSVLYHIFQSTQGDSEPSDQSLRWVEADGVKYLFHSEQKWRRKDGRDFAHAAWNYLGFAQ